MKWKYYISDNILLKPGIRKGLEGGPKTRMGESPKILTGTPKERTLPWEEFDPHTIGSFSWNFTKGKQQNSCSSYQDINGKMLIVLNKKSQHSAYTRWFAVVMSWHTEWETFWCLESLGMLLCVFSWEFELKITGMQIKTFFN